MTVRPVIQHTRRVRFFAHLVKRRFCCLLLLPAFSCIFLHPNHDSSEGLWMKPSISCWRAALCDHTVWSSRSPAHHQLKSSLFETVINHMDTSVLICRSRTLPFTMCCHVVQPLRNGFLAPYYCFSPSLMPAQHQNVIDSLCHLLSSAFDTAGQAHLGRGSESNS